MFEEVAVQIESLPNGNRNLIFADQQSGVRAMVPMTQDGCDALAAGLKGVMIAKPGQILGNGQG